MFDTAHILSYPLLEPPHALPELPWNKTAVAICYHTASTDCVNEGSAACVYYHLVHQVGNKQYIAKKCMHENAQIGVHHIL